jgi:trk system potassium uptake protein TrkA
VCRHADTPPPEFTPVKWRPQICLYRDDTFNLPEKITELEVGDEVILVTHRNRLSELKKRFASQNNS